MKKGIFIVLLLSCFLTACDRNVKQDQPQSAAGQYQAYQETGEGGMRQTTQQHVTVQQKDNSEGEQDKTAAPAIVEVDLSSYFENLNGSAVFYDPQRQEYAVYNRELADSRRSPCSTFKIVSSLAGLKNGVISKEKSVRQWSGEKYWKEDWNRDINFQDAFSTSCVWYFRKIIDELGEETIQYELDKLDYGNCDSSDWEGRLNTNNNNRALTGFWVESSLLISPKEQTQVMERIFGDQSEYEEEILDVLKEVMLVDQSEDTLQIYGKTGMGKKDGIVVDAWFVGFFEQKDAPVYFAVYLGESGQPEASSKTAKEIAVNVCKNYDALTGR